MNRKEITKKLSELTEKLISPNGDSRIYWAREVTFDYGSKHPFRIDYVKFKPLNNSIHGIERGYFYCYEIKSSIADFNSRSGHNFIGDFNYYIMPIWVYETIKDQIPKDIGVYCYEHCEGLRLVKKARRKIRERPIPEILLMMLRSAARDRNKMEEK